MAVLGSRLAMARRNGRFRRGPSQCAVLGIMRLCVPVTAIMVYVELVDSDCSTPN